MAAGVSEGLLRAEHKKLPLRQVFEKKGVEIPKNIVFDHFCRIIELNTKVLEPLLLS